MKTFIIVNALTLLLTLSAFGQVPPSQSAVISGQVVDATTENPIESASIALKGNPAIGVTTDYAGKFYLHTPKPNSDEVTVVVSHLGYGSHEVAVKRIDSRDPSQPYFNQLPFVIRLQPVSISREEVIITRGRVASEESRTVSNLNRELVDLSYGAQDVPLIVSETPSATAFSWSGSSVGAASMKIRGFDQTRLGVAVNGIPINDPEDHEVYWQDTPDFLSNTYDLQIERGVSSYMSGSAGLGGGVNLSTVDAVSNREFALTYQGGKFNTHRRTFAFRSGLMDNESRESSYNFTSRFSHVSTDGYRDHTSAEMWSYFLAATRYDPKMVTRLQIYGGQEEMDAYWWGLDKATLEKNRKANYSAWNEDYHEEFFWDPKVDYKGERDFFQQPHYTLHNQIKISDDITFDESLFWIQGDGFYEEYKPRRKFSEYNLTPFDDVYDDDGDGILDTVTVNETDLIRRKYVEKDHYGWLPRLNWNISRMTTLNTGLELRAFQGKHYGRVMWARDLPDGISPMHEWYRWKSDKSYIGGYANVDHRVNSKLKLNAGLQVRRITYKVDQEMIEAFPGYEYELDWTFVNPRVGATYQFDDNTKFYTSLAVAGREPIDDQIYDPDNPIDIPKLSKYGHVEINPERMLDIEIGGSHNYGSLTVGTNLYVMLFNDEIVTTGFSSDLDEAVYDNAPTSRHIGIEIEGNWVSPLPGLSLNGNVSYGQATLGDYTIDHVVGVDANWVPIIEQVNLDGNQIGGFPNLIGNLRATYTFTNVTSSLHVQHVGKQFMDNREDDNASLDAYTTLNGIIRYRMHNKRFGTSRFTGLDLEMRGMNLLDSEYEPYGVVDVEYGTPYYVPAAGRSYLAGVTFRL